MASGDLSSLIPNMIEAITPVYYNDAAINTRYTVKDSIISTNLYQYKITYITKDSLNLTVIDSLPQSFFFDQKGVVNKDAKKQR